MIKQCPSCGGYCGRTKKSGCNYGKTPPQNKTLTDVTLAAVAEPSEVDRLTWLLGNEREISDTLALRVDELKRELGDLPEAQRDLMARNKKLHHANQNLVAALDRIHDVLNGVYVDDIAGIVNRAIAANTGVTK